MAELIPASYTAGACHTAQGDRLMWSSVICTEGVQSVVGGDLAVTVGTTGLSVSVASGSAFINGDNVSDQGMYHVVNLGAETLTLAASDPTDSRTDLVVATVRDSQYSGTNDDWILQVITGAASPAPTPPPPPANSIPLANVTVAPGATPSFGVTVVDARQQAMLCDSLLPTVVTGSQIKARMTRQAARAYGSGQPVQNLWDTTTYNDGMTTTPTGIVVPRTGYYRVTLQVALNNTVSTGLFNLAIRVNGVNVRTVYRSNSWGAPAPTVHQGTSIVPATAGQAIDGETFHTAGGTINNYTGTNYETFLEVEWVR